MGGPDAGSPVSRVQATKVRRREGRAKQRKRPSKCLRQNWSACTPQAFLVDGAHERGKEKALEALENGTQEAPGALGRAETRPAGR